MCFGVENILFLTLYKVPHIQQKLQQIMKFQWKHILVACSLATSEAIILFIFIIYL